MGRRVPSLDARAANLAAAAKLVAKSNGASAVAAFASLCKNIPRVSTAHRSPFFDPTDFLIPFAQSEAAHRDGRMLTLRLDLETALLRLDACCPLAAVRVNWPDKKDFGALDQLVEDTALMIAKTPPPLGWARYQRVDRHFPKLRLCRRVTGLVTRITACMASRPLAALTGPAGSENEALTKKFWDVWVEIHKNGRDAGTVNWIEYVPLLSRYQNAELQRARKGPLNVLRTRPDTPSGPPAIAAYVAYLEFERADFLWNSRHRPYWTLLTWLQALGNAALLRKVQPFCAVALNIVTSSIEQLEERKVSLRRARAAARKAKSRKKLREKV